MEEVPYYGLSWFGYLLLSGTFLFLSWRKSQNLSLWIRVPLLTLIVAMAFTPAATIPGQDWWSPAAIVMVFDIDQSGFKGFWRAGLGIIMVWLVLMIGTSVRIWLKRRNILQPDTENKERSKT